MKIYIGADHAGFELKLQLINFLQDECGIHVEDLGAHVHDPLDDYPDHVLPVAEAVAAASVNREEVVGIVLGGSGQGEALVANRIVGVRAALYYGYQTEIVRLAREHNDANILSLGARFLNEDQAKEAVKIFLETAFSGDERHQRRITKIDQHFK